MDRLKEYFKGDELACSVYLGKYALKDNSSKVLEETPDLMHKRLAKELKRAEDKYEYILSEEKYSNLSNFGKSIVRPLTYDEIYSYLDGFNQIVLQGSIMSMLGNPYAVGSLSNCFVVPAPYDSYAGILKTDEHLAQLMKRRAGVGANINTLRPENSLVKNAARTSTGAVSFMHRFSNTTREVAQNGRK